MSIKIKKFQMGGGMPPQGAPAPAPATEQGGQPAQGGEGGDPVMQLVEMAAQALESQDPNMAMSVCEGLVGLAQGGAGGPGAPQEEPVMMRKGGKVTVCKMGKKMKK